MPSIIKLMYPKFFKCGIGKSLKFLLIWNLLIVFGLFMY